MKHRIFLTICLALLSFVARAQQGLSVNALFTGKVVPREEMVEVRKMATDIKQTNRKGATTFIMAFPKQHGLYRYLCYLTLTKGHLTMVTVVYMEGNVASIAELGKLVN